MTDDIAEFRRRIEDFRQRMVQFDQSTGQEGRAQGPDITFLVEELEVALEELQVAGEELRQQNEQLQAAYGQIEQERQRFADMFELAPDSYLLTTPDGLITRANQAARELLGAAHGSAVSKPLSLFLPLEDSLEFHRRLSQAVQRGSAMDWEMRLRRPDGPPLAVAVNIATVSGPDWGVTQLLWLLRDITPRKQAENELRAAADALRRQGERLSLMHELDRAILAGWTAEDIASLVLRRLGRALDGARASVLIFDLEREEVDRLATYPAPDEGGGSPRATAGRPERLDRSVLLPELERGELAILRNSDSPAFLEMAGMAGIEGMRCLVSAPLMVQHALTGILNLAATHERLPEDESLETLREAADALAAGLHHHHMAELAQRRQDELTSLSQQLLQVQEDERRAIARELHDEAGQGLTAILAGLTLVERDADPSVTANLHELKEIAGNVMQGLHRLAMRLRPVTLDYLGLVPAIRQLLDGYSGRDGLTVEFVQHGLGERARFATEVEIMIYRLVQEAVTNVFRHAHAGRVGVLLELRDETLVAIVEDDGIGFDPEHIDKPDSLGLVGLRERAALLGGRLAIESAPGSGTAVIAQLPVAVHGAEPSGESP